MSATEKVVNDLNVSKLMLCNPKMLTSEMCVRIGQAINSAIDLLKEQEPLEPLREEIEQAGPLYHRCYCKKCGHHVGNMIKNKVTEVHENFCSSCGKAVKWE